MDAMDTYSYLLHDLRMTYGDDIAPYVTETIRDHQGEDAATLILAFNNLLPKVGLYFDLESSAIEASLSTLYDVLMNEVGREIEAENFYGLLNQYYLRYIRLEYGIEFHEETSIYQLVLFFQTLYLLQDLDREYLEEIYYILTDDNLQDIEALMVSLSKVSEIFQYPALPYLDEDNVVLVDILNISLEHIKSYVYERLSRLKEIESQTDADHMVESELRAELTENQFPYFQDLLMQEPFIHITNKEMLLYYLSDYFKTTLGTEIEVKTEELAMKIFRAVVTVCITHVFSYLKESKAEPMPFEDYKELIHYIYSHYMEACEATELGERVFQIVDSGELNYFKRTYGIISRTYEKYRVYHNTTLQTGEKA